MPSKASWRFSQFEGTQDTDGCKEVGRYHAVEGSQGEFRGRYISRCDRTTHRKVVAPRGCNLSSLFGLRLSVVGQLNNSFQPAKPEPAEALLHGAKASGRPLRLVVCERGIEVEVEEPVSDMRCALCSANEGSRPAMMACDEMFYEALVVGSIVQSMADHQLR